MRKNLIFLLLPLFLIVVAGCSSRVNTEQSPRRVVVQMLKTVEEGDREAIAHFLDFATLLRPGNRDYALQMDSVREFRTPDDILDDLSKGGITYERWMAMQRIVADDSITAGGDTAFVEVSFISREINKQYYNKWGLIKKNETWKIFSFGILPPSDED